MKLMIEIPEDVYNGIKILEKAGGVNKDTQITIPMEALANGKVIDKEDDIYSPR